VAQLLSFLSFWCIYLIFLYRIYKYNPDIWTMDKAKPWYNSWRTLATVLFISCIGILVCEILFFSSEVKRLIFFRRYVPVSGLLSCLKGSMALSQQTRHFSTCWTHCLCSLLSHSMYHFGLGGSYLHKRKGSIRPRRL
jgi:hypothetical protein